MSTAWLITWEGSEAEFNGRCKIVAILPPQLGQDTVVIALRILYYSESNLTLAEKQVPLRQVSKDPYFRKGFVNEGREYYYGIFAKHYLKARRVKNVRCEENRKDCMEHTLYWTELKKILPDPKFGEAGPPAELIHEANKEVTPERHCNYTYSPREAIEGEVSRSRKAKK